MLRRKSGAPYLAEIPGGTLPCFVSSFALRDDFFLLSFNFLSKLTSKACLYFRVRSAVLEEDVRLKSIQNHSVT